MNVVQALEVMNSDYRLWETAETIELGGGRVEKRLDLPWGIGATVVTLEGMNDATKRREALGAYGDYIRGLINEATDDEAITRRAQAAAALREPPDGGDSDQVGADQGLRDAGLQAPPNASPSAAHEGHAEDSASLGETLTARRAALRERINRVEADLARWRREVKGIDAALAAMEDD